MIIIYWKKCTRLLFMSIQIMLVCSLCSHVFATAEDKFNMYNEFLDHRNLAVVIKVNDNDSLSRVKDGAMSLKKTPYYTDKLRKQKNLVGLLRQNEVEVKYVSEYGNGIIAILSLEKLKDIQEFSYIQDIRVPLGGYGSSLPQDLVNVQYANQYGYYGQQESVCIIDSGIDTSNPAFSGRILDQKCYCNVGGGCCSGGLNVSNNAEDDNGHGTAMAGIIAADSLSLKGLAPKAGLVIVKVLDNNKAFYSTVEIGDAIDWCTDYADVYNISVISMSFINDELFNVLGGSYC